MKRSERILVLLLRLCGGIMLLAFPAALLPSEWMAAHHVWLGLGPFPAGALVDYLTRSASMLYGIHGGILLVVASRPRRYRSLILYLALMNMVFGAAMVAIDLNAAMPSWWTLVEGPSIFAFGLVMLVLLRDIPAE
jgi:hypothetical protein